MRFIQLGTPGRDEHLINLEAIAHVERNQDSDGRLRSAFPWKLSLLNSVKILLTDEDMEALIRGIEGCSEASPRQPEQEAPAALPPQPQPPAPAPPQPAADGIEKHWGPRVIG